MSQVQRHVRVDGQAIPDPLLALHVRQALGQPLWLEARFIAGAPPSNPGKHFSGMLGKPVTLELKNAEGEGHHARLDCRVTQASVDTHGYALVGQGPLHGLMMAPRSRGFVNMSPGEVIDRVLKDAGATGQVKASTIPLAKNPQPYIAQYAETDFDFIHRLASWVGLVVYEHAGKVAVSAAPEGTAVVLDSTDILAARIVVQPVAVASEAVAMSYLPHEITKGALTTIGLPADSSHRPALDGSTKAIYGGATALSADAHPKTASDLADQLRARARQLAAQSIRYEFQTYRPEVQVGVKLEVTGHDLIKEKLFVVEIAMDHAPRTTNGTRDGGDDDPFATRVVAVPEKMVGPVKLVAPGRSGVVSAIVQNKDDLKKLGRVQLQFAWDKEPTAWARVATYSAGANHGAFWLPEVGDEVLVDFEFGDPSRPVVVGSLYHDSSKPQAGTKHDTPEVLLARTRAGTEIRLVQAADGEKIWLKIGKEGPEICLTGGKAADVAITVKGGTCNLKARDITITAEEKVNIQGGTLALESKGEISIKARGPVKVTGSKINLN